MNTQKLRDMNLHAVADKPVVTVPNRRYTTSEDGWHIAFNDGWNACRDAMLATAPSHSQQSADSSESLREIIEREADRFFEWPSADKSHVTAVSTKLFAEHIATLYASPNRCPAHDSEQGGGQ